MSPTAGFPALGFVFVLVVFFLSLLPRRFINSLFYFNSVPLLNQLPVPFIHMRNTQEIHPHHIGPGISGVLPFIWPSGLYVFLSSV